MWYNVDMYFQDIIVTVFEPTLIKVGATAALSYGFLFGEFHSQAIIAILMLMVFDTILGVMATWHEGKPITSRKFSRVVQKGAVYFISISAGYFADTTTGINIIQSTMIAFIGVTEFISILENMGRMGFQTPKKLLNQLKDFQSLK
jgi:toxin secretion/phage lysis holin